ncbi:hypothetical protein HANVADRAFT_52147 [Hanseniaspora valbyensis NRRL Y-1626]|uniref:Copper transport protein n=1 Tax=Hanseniaspora valbyensis NRRL Y-1626 TaxID=766949 RepID=A0A1B7TG50_9ASCO|nr:hypothetical protein HANVADRAFT_52147 [Hanseniaspora valbyensis NRRL Y-1626]
MSSSSSMSMAMSSATTTTNSMSMAMSSATTSSSSMSMAMSSATTTSSSMRMAMSSATTSSSSMNMAMSSAFTSSSSSMTMAMSSSITPASSSSMIMDMSSTTTSATTSSSGMSGMSGMSSSSTSTSSSSMDMSMNSYLTSNWKNYPVLFKKLKADTRGKLFGIFLLLIVATFVYKATGFTLWYLELRWSKLSSGNNRDISEEERLLREKRGRSLIGEIFLPSGYDFLKDAVRAVLVFWSTLIAYMLMLAAMSFILTYIFGIVLGLALFEVFFNRIKIVVLRERRLKTISDCKTTNAGVCTCGDHDFSRSSTDVEYDEKDGKDVKKGLSSSCCGGGGNAGKDLEEDEPEHDINVANQLTNNNPAQMTEELEPSSRFL